jgi:hypothetical protein
MAREVSSRPWEVTSSASLAAAETQDDDRRKPDRKPVRMAGCCCLSAEVADAVSATSANTKRKYPDILKKEKKNQYNKKYEEIKGAIA